MTTGTLCRPPGTHRPSAGARLGPLGGLCWGVLWLLTAPVAPAMAAEGADAFVTGRVLAVQGACEWAGEAAGPWRALRLQDTLVTGHRLRCREGGELRLRLPGSGIELPLRLRPDQHYVVPVARRGPTLPAPTRPGREASARPDSYVAPGSGGAEAVAEVPGLVRCPEPLGTVTVASPAATGGPTGAGSVPPREIVALLSRLIIGSNCFVLADGAVRRLQAERMLREREPAAEQKTSSGGLWYGFGGSPAPEPRAPHYVLQARAQPVDNAGMLLPSLLGGIRSAIPGATASAAASAGRKLQSTLESFDLRSGVQTAVIEGRADAVDAAALRRWLSATGDAEVMRYVDTAQGADFAAALAASLNRFVEWNATGAEPRGAARPARPTTVPTPSAAGSAAPAASAASAASAPRGPATDAPPSDDPSRQRP